MGWLQGAIWSNAHVRAAVTSFKTRQPADFPALAPLRSFRDV
jgi:enoyl-CoA hydratase